MTLEANNINKKPHETVLLGEAVDGLAIKADGLYIDCTFGRGGHSRKILDSLNDDGRLMVFDQDPIAFKQAKELQERDSRVVAQHTNFSAVLEKVTEQGWLNQVDGVLMDLGVSSPQLDEADRGFSFLRDGPLDMRMNNSSGQTAAEWVNTAPQEEIADVLWHYGDERLSRKIAAAIVMDREKKPFTTTLQLAGLLERIMPSSKKSKGKKEKHPATRTFQAIRIFINDELGVLKRALDVMKEVLAPSGRLVVISFHSLEDRLVKQFIRGVQNHDIPRGLPVPQTRPDFKSMGKPVKASEEELAVNVRSRSAVMRVAERVGGAV